MKRSDLEKFDLLDVFYFRDILKRGRLQFALQLVALLFMGWIVVRGLLSEPDLRFGGDPFAAAMVWDVWHPFLAFTVIFFGRLWCAVCPLGAVGDWVGRRFSLGRLYPARLRNLWPGIFLFIFVFAGERHLFMFTRNPVTTAYLLLAFTGLAVVMGVYFEKRAFCRYICPIGLVLSLFSMLGILELRCKSKDVCREHRIKECIRGNERGMPCPMGEFPQTMERSSFCIYCSECIKTCSRDNIRIGLRPPGSDLFKQAHLDEAFLIHSIIIIFLFVMGMEHFVFRNIIVTFVKSTGINRNIWAMIIFVFISLLASALLYSAARTTTPNARGRFARLSYAFLPFALSVYLAENAFRFIRGIFYLASGLGDLLGRAWIFSISLDTITIIQILLLIGGFMFSAWAGIRMSRQHPEEPRARFLFPLFFTLTIYLALGLRILTLPLD